MPSSGLSSAPSGLITTVEAAEACLERRHSPPDLVEFAEDVLRPDLDPWQADVLAGDWKRALLNITRQGGKSTVAAVLGLFEALFRPGSLTLIVGPSDRQSGELFRKLVALRDLVPPHYELIEDTKRSKSVRGGGRVASLPGSETMIRGFSAATLIIEDEATRVEDALYTTVRPMLATTNGRLRLLSTPFGRRGHFWKEWTDGGDGWKRVEIPATKIPCIASEFLAEEEAAPGSWWHRQEYLCEFCEADDSFFRNDDLVDTITSDVKPLFRIGACS